VLLPLTGFLVESLDFMVFHALAWRGMTNDPSAPLFTLRPWMASSRWARCVLLRLEIEAGPVHSTG